MYRALLRGLGIISILGGVYVLYWLIQAFQAGVFTFSPDSWSITLLLAYLRMICLIACGVTAWRAPKYAVWFSFGAFLFGISGAAQYIYTFGLVKGITTLMPSYYLMLSFHGIVAILIWWLTKAMSEDDHSAPLPNS